MILKYALRHFARRPVVNFLLILQMAAIHLVCVAMISSIVSRYDEYQPLKSVLDGEGIYYGISQGFETDTGLAAISAEHIQSRLKGNSRVCCSYNPYGYVYYENTWNMDDFEMITYDDALLYAQKPRLRKGKWFQPGEDYGDSVPVVVSENTGYFVGDHLTYTQDYEHKTVYDAVVIGILPNTCKILNPTLPEPGVPMSAHYLYSNFSASDAERMLLIAPEQQFSKQSHGQPHGLIIVQYPDGISKEEQSENDLYMLSLHMLLGNCELPTLRDNTKVYIYAQCLTLMPIAVSVLILTLTSILSMSALSAKRQLRDYAVYAVCGLPWKRCAQVQAAEILIAGAAAFAVTWGVLAFWNPFSQFTVIRAGWQQLLGSAAVVLICYLTAAVLPRRLFRQHTAKDILQENGR